MILKMYLSLPATERFDHLMDILNVLKSGSGSSSSSSSITDDNKPPRNVTDWNHIELNNLQR